jgi:hypothetical protein
MRIRSPAGEDQRAVVCDWPCIGSNGAEATRRLLITYDALGNGRAWTPELATAQGLAIVSAEPAERRRLYSLGYRLADVLKRPNKLFR